MAAATDYASRYLLLCEALKSTREDLAITPFEQLFPETQAPEAIRSDNGVPFASPNALFNLSKLSVWWLRLGVAIERIKPKTRQRLDRPCRPAPGNQRSRRRLLDRQLHELRSWLHRSGAEDLATPRQPVRPEIVTHVIGTVRYLCLRVRHIIAGGDGGVRTHDPNLCKVLFEKVRR